MNMCGRKYYGGMYDWMNGSSQGSSGNFMNGIVDKATDKSHDLLILNGIPCFPDSSSFTYFLHAKELVW